MAEVTLRPVTAADLDFVYRCQTDCRPGFDSATEAPSRFELWMFVNGYRHDLEGQGQLLFVIEGGGHRVGTLEFADYEPDVRTASVGIYITPGQRGRGYARAALDAACELSRELALVGLTALIAPANAPSQALFSACGFVRETDQLWRLTANDC